MSHRGDTIVEVMFATAVVGLVIVLSMAVMNRGVATTQMAVENTLVRQSIDGQAEALRYFRDTDSDQWNVIPTINEATVLEDCKPPVSGAFYIDTKKDNVKVKPYSSSTTDTFAQPGNGLWIEAIKNQPTQRFIDFHIRACWDPPFSGPKASIGTIVRLYD